MGRLEAVPAASTPGIARMRASSAPYCAIVVGISPLGNEVPETSTWSDRNPGSIERRFQKLRASSAAPATSTSDRHTSETTSADWVCFDARLAVAEREPDFSASLISKADARQAGRKPNRSPAAAETASANATTP